MSSHSQHHLAHLFVGGRKLSLRKWTLQKGKEGIAAAVSAEKQQKDCVTSNAHFTDICTQRFAGYILIYKNRKYFHFFTKHNEKSMHNV